MSDPLATYLQDHLAASNFAIDLLKSLRDRHAGESLGKFTAALLMEVEEESQLLERIIHQIGAEGSTLKEATAWLGEKMSRFKFAHAGSGDAETFQALETVALGLLGKLALWRALSVIPRADVRIPGVDFNALATRSQAQHARVEELRLQIAATAFRTARA